MILVKLKNLNYLLIFLIILLSFIGAAGQYSAAEGSYDPWAGKHLIRSTIFVFLAIIISLINLKIFYKYVYIIFILSLFLLLSVEVIGIFGKGASRWIRVFGFSLQPSEIIKITIVLALAKYYHNLKFDNISNPLYLFIPLLIIFLPFILVLVQPDLGTALSILLLGILILFAAYILVSYFLLALSRAIVFPFFLILFKVASSSSIRTTAI